MVTKIKRPNKVYFHHDTGWDLWQWEIAYSNSLPMINSKWHAKRAAMLHQLAIVHGKEIRDGDSVINGRQFAAWRWDLDAALVEAGILKPSPETQEAES